MGPEDWEKVRISPVEELKRLKISVGGIFTRSLSYRGPSIQNFTSIQTTDIEIKNYKGLKMTRELV